MSLCIGLYSIYTVKLLEKHPRHQKVVNQMRLDQAQKILIIWVADGPMAR